MAQGTIKKPKAKPASSLKKRYAGPTLAFSWPLQTRRIAVTSRNQIDSKDLANVLTYLPTCSDPGSKRGPRAIAPKKAGLIKKKKLDKVRCESAHRVFFYRHFAKTGTD